MTKANALIIAKMFPAFVSKQLQEYAPDDIVRRVPGAVLEEEAQVWLCLWREWV